MKLEISLFRFDYKSDYLPYYTKNFVKVKNEKTLLDILNNINLEHPFGFENSVDFYLCINGIYTKASRSAFVKQALWVFRCSGLLFWFC